MNNFIEITISDSENKALIPIRKICSIVCNADNTCFIETGCDSSGVSSGICTVETYDEIKQQLKQLSSKKRVISNLNRKLKSVNWE